MTIDHTKQIEELHRLVTTRLAPSPIDGVGLFALTDIPKGRKLYTDITPILYNIPYKKFKKINTRVAGILLGQFPQIVNGSNFIYPTARTQAYINHSDTPNYDPSNDVTLCDIKRGEEITEDYRMIEGWEIAHPWLVTK